MLGLSLALPGVRRRGSNPNLISFPAGFDNAAWTKSSVTVTADAAAAPDGTTTAERLVGTAATSYVDQGFSLAAATTAAASLHVKYESGPTAAILQLTDGSANAFLASVTLGTSTIAAGANIGGAAIIRVGAEALPNGWYRYFIVGTTHGSTATYRLRFVIGNATSVLTWGAKLERSAFPSAYP